MRFLVTTEEKHVVRYRVEAATVTEALDNFDAGRAEPIFQESVEVEVTTIEPEEGAA